jgi:cation diffusion facilitator CzcD-associated flavoprotein CzcO
MKPSLTEYEVIVIGAGASGIGAAIKLREAGITNFVVLEKADNVGGTWRDNTYPGCASDVPSMLYSYSFAPNPGWTRAFAGQPEIQDYLVRTARERGVLPYVRFGVEVHEVRWDDAAARWHLQTHDGPMSAQSVIAAAGPWHEPNLPDFPGIDTFGGEVFHSARWNHDVHLTGKRVAVVGTGASAVQFVPQIAPRVERLHLFQRTPQWVLPKPDASMPRALRLAMRAPGVRNAVRAGQYQSFEGAGFAFRHPSLQPLLKTIGKANIRRGVKDPELRRTLTPTWGVGCKRLLMSNDYYPALNRLNVDVHATAVREIRGNVVVGADGTEAEADVLIFGTGFKILDMPVAGRILDADGRSLADHWEGSPQAYLGTTVAGFPNLYLILGPSLGTATSAFVVIEAQLNYVVQALAHLRATRAAALEVRANVQDAYNAEVQAALPGTVYNSGGCSSYYFDRNGRNSFSWPWSTNRMLGLLRRFRPADYQVRRTTEQRIPA